MAHQMTVYVVGADRMIHIVLASPFQWIYGEFKTKLGKNTIRVRADGVTKIAPYAGFLTEEKAQVYVDLQPKGGTA